MRCNKTVSRLALGVALGLCGTTNALAGYKPNDNYSTFVLSYQRSNFAEPVCIGAECHGGVSGPAALFARQIIPNVALGLTGSYLQSDGNTSSIKSTYVSVFAQGIVGLGSQVDVGASVAPLQTTLELCVTSPSVCASSSDSGIDLGVFGKVFLNREKSVNLGLSYNKIDFHNSPDLSIVALSLVTILAKHHRLAFSVDRSIDANGNAVSGGYGFGYSYLVYY